jgi:hypothetical protein
MFENLDYSARETIYRGLLRLVKTNTGIGFLNNADQGHPTYVLGAQGKPGICENDDNPEKNTLYKMMRELSETLKHDECDTLEVCENYVFSWQDFCKMATEGYQQARGQKAMLNS